MYFHIKMRSTVKYSELFKQLIGILVIPLILAAVFIIVMYLLKMAQISEAIISIYSIVGSVVVVLSGIFIVRKLVMVSAEVEYDSNGIYFQFKNNSFLYNETSITIRYEDINEIVFDETENYRVYVKLKIRQPKKTNFISPEEYSNNPDFSAYWSDVKLKIEHEIAKQKRTHEK